MSNQQKSTPASSDTMGLRRTPSEATLVDSSATYSTGKGTTAPKSSPHPKQKKLSSQKDKFNTWEARLAHVAYR